MHATPEEQELLERACDEIARAARTVVVFGEGGARLAALLEQRQVDLRAADDLADAVAVAAAVQPSARVTAVVFSPMFPLAPEQRALFAVLVSQHA